MVLQKFAYVYVLNITKQIGDINDNNNSRAKSFTMQGTSLMENYIQFHNGFCFVYFRLS